ncbi:efflux RND transporter permease subunit [Campylobacter helveticus]|uniref:efflux RND transporter permease subunit n=1 Tax=Campylobacter helveticus TaxID=28898 RepID=UPI001486F945|nr:MMPL family transporter [Campylobacter helveticus]
MMAFFLKFLINHPKSTLLSTLLFCVFLSFFAFKLHIDASAESLLLEDDKDLKIFRELSKHYKSDNFLMLAFKPNDKNPFSEESLKNLESLHQKLEGVRGVERVFSIINAPLLLSSENKDLKELMQNIPSILSEDINQTKAQNEILTSPFYLNNIIAKDGKTTALIIYLKPDLTYINLIEARDNAKDENEKEHLRIQIKNHQEMQNALNKALLEQIRSIMSAYEKDGKLYLGGVSMISDDMISYIKDDLALYGIFLVFLLGFALWYFFRSFTLMILSLLICFISLSSASGLFFALLNFPITVISSNYAPLMLIITLSVVVHLITHFIEISRLYPNTTQKRLVLQTLLSKAKPSFFAIFTTMIGFFSLIFSQIEPIIKLGIMMSLGIALGLILAYLFLASALVLLKRKNFTQREFNLSFLLFCANASIRHRKLIYTLAFITIILALIGIPKLKVENSFVNYFKDGSAIKEGLLVIDKDLGGTLPLDIIVRFKDNKKNELKESEVLDSFENEFESLAAKDTYWFDSKKTRIAKKVHQFLENKEFVGSVLSLNSLLMLGKNINEGKDLDDFALAFLNENLPENFKQDLLSPFVNITQNELKFSIRVIDSNPNLKRDTFLKSLKTELNELLKDEGVEVQITGIMLLYNNMLQSLFSSQFDTLAFVVLAIFVLFVLIFRSFKIATIAIVCNLIPLSLVFAFMGFLNIPLDLMSITIAAIAIGIGVDDILHYIYRFKEELKCASVKKAVLNSHLFIGTALYYTTISIVLGFSVMMSSNFIPTIYFGILTTLVMILLLFGSLFLLPSLLISFYAKKNNKPKLLR